MKWLDSFSNTLCSVARYLSDNKCSSLVYSLFSSYGIWKTLDGRIFSSFVLSSNSRPCLSHLKYFSCKGKHIQINVVSEIMPVVLYKLLTLCSTENMVQWLWKVNKVTEEWIYFEALSLNSYGEPVIWVCCCLFCCFDQVFPKYTYDAELM